MSVLPFKEDEDFRKHNQHAGELQEEQEAMAMYRKLLL